METVSQTRLALIKRWGGIIAGVLGLAGLIWYITRYSSEFYYLRKISAIHVGTLSLVVLLGHIFIALRFRLMAETFAVDLSLWEAFLLTEAGGFLNIAPLGLGTGFRAAYLKTVRRLKFVDFSLGFLVSLLTEFVAAGSLGILFSLTLPRTSTALYALFLAYIIIPIGVLVVGRFVRRSVRFKSFTQHKGERWWSRLFRSLIRGVEIILDKPQMVFYWFVLNILTDLVLGTRYWLIGAWMGYSTDFASGMVLQSVTRLTAAITVMPSGTIGLREALTGLGATGLGQSAVSGVMISTVDRIIATAWIVLLGSISLFILRSKIAQATLPETTGLAE